MGVIPLKSILVLGAWAFLTAPFALADGTKPATDAKQRTCDSVDIESAQGSPIFMRARFPKQFDHQRIVFEECSYATDKEPEKCETLANRRAVFPRKIIEEAAHEEPKSFWKKFKSGIRAVAKITTKSIEYGSTALVPVNWVVSDGVHNIANDVSDHLSPDEDGAKKSQLVQAVLKRALACEGDPPFNYNPKDADLILRGYLGQIAQDHWAEVKNPTTAQSVADVNATDVMVPFNPMALNERSIFSAKDMVDTSTLASEPTATEHSTRGGAGDIF